MRFSQKIGKTSFRDSIQIDSIDEKLENRLWNTILLNFFDEIGVDINHKVNRDSDIEKTLQVIWQDFFGNPVDEIPKNIQSDISARKFMGYIKEWFFRSQWYEKYDFLEFLSKLDLQYFELSFTEECNNSLKSEMSAYRLVDGDIVQITSEEEIIEIEEALVNSSIWEPVNTHLKTAITYFSNRENPDYRNSVKEAISAVESVCKIIVGNNNTTLAPALKIIEVKHKIHRALRSAFTSIYGFASDAGGIRHSLLLDDIEVSMEDAKFILVSCSAFINYLKVKIEK
ncbi:AbiJ-NTD4 domain-containing protein [Flavobacterium sp. LB3P122]|uniref:AbiJ-NTD4 domain-containing protein n=1 Tax=Flavobacterium algoriphilum TaxID=3398738 RepID=UPI003A8A159A